VTIQADRDHNHADAPQLTIAELRIGHRTVVAAAGELDSATAGELSDALGRVVDSGAPDVWIDLTNVTSMDSSGLELLLSTQSALAGGSRRLALICPEGPVRRALEIAGVASALEIHPDRSSAHAAS
jgi:anti-anti-sigma factor